MRTSRAFRPPEFLVMTLRQLKVDPEKELQGLFEALDSDGSGKINTLKLRDALGVRSLRCRLSHAATQPPK